MSRSSNNGLDLQAQIARDIRAALANPQKRAELQIGPMTWFVPNRQMRRLLARRARTTARDL